jgi:hypothetical protein
MKVMVNDVEINMVPTALIKMETAELIELHNELYPDNKPLKAWRSAKTKLVAKIMADFNDDEADEEEAPAPKKAKGKAKAKPAKKKAAKKEPKERAPSKSARMLALLEEAGDEGLAIDEIVESLSTSEGSVRSYVSYYRGGKKGHDVVPMYAQGGFVYLGERPAPEPKPAPKKPAKAKAKKATKKGKK